MKQNEMEQAIARMRKQLADMEKELAKQSKKAKKTAVAKAEPKYRLVDKKDKSGTKRRYIYTGGKFTGAFFNTAKGIFYIPEKSWDVVLARKYAKFFRGLFGGRQQKLNDPKFADSASIADLKALVC